MSSADVISELSVEDFSTSRFVQPRRLRFTHNGVQRAWDVVEAHDSVAILVYHVDLRCLLLVRQFRPPVLFASQRRAGAALPAAYGFTYEACAGLVDKAKPLATIAKEEVEEELGYSVQESSLTHVGAIKTAVGIAGGTMHFFYAEVTSAQRVEGGGGGLRDEGEFLDVCYLPERELPSFLRNADCNMPVEGHAMLQWYLNTQVGRSRMAHPAPPPSPNQLANAGVSPESVLEVSTVALPRVDGVAPITMLPDHMLPAPLRWADPSRRPTGCPGKQSAMLAAAVAVGAVAGVALAKCVLR
jgi:UDP-sugar diphosphatase